MAASERMRFLRRELNAYLSTRSVTQEEQEELEDWVRRGFSVYDNPWHICFEDGWPADYLWAKQVNDEIMEELMNTPAVKDSD